MGKNRRREKNRALYISKLMYRGSITQLSNIQSLLEHCAPLYIAKLQDKALCRLNTRLQQEFTRENIKLKNIWEVGGVCVEKQRKFGKVKGTLRNFARWVFMVRNGQISHHEENLLAKWCSHGLCSCFHLKFKPVNVQNPCLTHLSSSSINWHA